MLYPLLAQSPAHRSALAAGDPTSNRWVKRNWESHTSQPTYWLKQLTHDCHGPSTHPKAANADGSHYTGLSH